MPRRNPFFDKLAQDCGIYFPDAMYLSDQPEARMAMDAQPTLITQSNAGIPAFLTTVVYPKVINVLLAPNNAAEVLGERRMGDWKDQTQLFPLVENTGFVASYGDYQTAGKSDTNYNFPQRQSYLFETAIEYGDLETERASLAKINIPMQKQLSAAVVMKKAQNLFYLYGIQGLQNYGLTNDPALSAPLAPGLKANGGVQWFVNNYPNATGAEVFSDVVALATYLINQSGNIITAKSKMTLALSGGCASALNFTNTFNVNVEDQLKKNYPNLRVVQVPQYAQVSSTNSQGVAAGNLVQLVADEFGGQETGFCAFNEMLRAHRLIPDMSSFKQKWSSGSWGAIIMQPVAFAQMIGV
jgi:Fe-S cluster biogenesis protein NfuA